MKKALYAVVAACALVAGSTAIASSTVVVTPASTQGWSASTQPGGQVDFVADASAPSGGGALRLTTDATATAEAQYAHSEDSVPLWQVSEMSYFTKQNAGGAPSYQLSVHLNGGTLGATTLVFEPSRNADQGAVVPGSWQQWNVATGHFWSSRSVSCPYGFVLEGGGGFPLYTLDDVVGMCPDAVVSGVGVDTAGPGFDAEADLVDFDGTGYDFETNQVPQTKDDCKKRGWRDFRRADGSSFKNQGDCVQYVNTGK
jgi:hypothetical protein